jgi:peptide-methionine (R)-S-oxide reductase
MFDSDLDKSDSPISPRRRTFLLGSVSALGAALIYSFRGPHIASAEPSKGTPGEVTVVRFSDDGRRLQKLHVPKVVKTEEEWRKQLSPNVFDITRHADTEMAFTGQYWNEHAKGLYRCICCNNALFSSETKFESGTGWPSFWDPIASENVRTSRDFSLGVLREAVSCTECDAHLGHVFDDGPPPTHLRYCMNSASLRFVKRA